MMATRSAPTQALPPTVVRDLGRAIEIAMDGAERILSGMGRSANPQLTPQATELVRSLIDAGNQFRAAPDDFAALGRSLERVLDMGQGLLALAEQEPEPRLQEAIRAGVGALIEASRAYNAAVRRGGVAQNAAWVTQLPS